MLRKIVCIVLDLLSLASIVGVLVMQHFATTRMGMIRWLNSYNRGIESSMPLDLLQIVAVVIAGICLTISIILTFKKKEAKKLVSFALIISAAICFLCILYVIFGTDTKTMRIHYFAILLFSLGSVFASVSNIVRNLKTRKEPELPH